MKILKIIVITLLFLPLGYFGFKSYQYAKAYEASTLSIAKLCDIDGLAQGKLDNLKSTISFGFIENKTKNKLDKLREEQLQYKQLSKQSLYYFMATLIVILLLSMTCSCMAIVFAISSLISLLLGLINPVLMVTIHKEVEYLGDIILSFESKGILGSIIKLFENSEYAVGGAILLFSVVIPLFKILTIIFVLIFREFNFAHNVVNLFKHLGKWSMLDVFVVAILLVYLTSSNSDVSKAQIQIGLYYFLIYVILSMLTTIKVDAILAKSN
ncbi:MAG: paraquat-inducible protein A [Epsilonproteobacteria bacterium]|nr:paraquat-inducible protein A [Campylobacterota bacterium]